MTDHANNPTDTEIADREFALAVVHRLRKAGFESVWAGGCVRDQLLGQIPRDYDVATNARPEQIQEIFGKRRTLAIGAAFGVIVVLGAKGQTPIEVATFRRDAEYSDGRHPDSVTFSSDREDAQRRDFTINGLFYDPIANQLLDYVGGERDLKRGLIRAIGDPGDRFREDKLRMLRAIRFTSTFEFELDAETMLAVQRYAADLRQVSAERIASELRRMLVHRNRLVAVDLLLESGLLLKVIPELTDFVQGEPWQTVRDSFTTLASTQCDTQGLLGWTETETFISAMACLLFPAGDEARSVGRRLKLSNEETEGIDWLVTTIPIINSAAERPWPQVQRILVRPLAIQAVVLASAIALATGLDAEGWKLCRRTLARPIEEWNPPPLINGDDLVANGLMPGREFKRILEAIRDAQLNQQLHSKRDAIAAAIRMVQQ